MGDLLAEFEHAGRLAGETHAQAMINLITRLPDPDDQAAVDVLGCAMMGAIGRMALALDDAGATDVEMGAWFKGALAGLRSQTRNAALAASACGTQQ